MVIHHCGGFIAKVNGLTTNNIPAGTSLRIPLKKEIIKRFIK